MPRKQDAQEKANGPAARSLYFPVRDTETAEALAELARVSGRTVNSVVITILRNEVGKYLADTSRLEPRPSQ